MMPSTTRSAPIAESKASKPPSWTAWIFASKCLLFIVLSLTLFLLSSRYVAIHDEGLELTGVMRTLAGQVPHRDFYYLYGAGSLYLLAGLFKLFGTSVLVERLVGVFASSLVVLSMYSLSRRYCERWVAITATLLTALWVATDPIQGFAPPIICLPILWSTLLIVPVADPTRQQRRMFCAGVLVAILFLLRYDFGIGVAVAHATTVAAFAMFDAGGVAESLRRWLRATWPYAAGFALIVTGPAIAYLRVAPLHDLLYDAFLFQAKYYRAGRGLPLPRLSFETLPDCVVYVAPMVLVLALYAIVVGLRPWRRQGADRSVLPEWICALTAYGVIAALIFVKGFVRTSAGQMFPCTVLCLLVLAVAAEHSKNLKRGALVACGVLALLFAVLGGSALQQKLLAEKHARSSVLKWIVDPEKQPPFAPERNWCEDGAPITKGFCYVLDQDRIRAVGYIKSHTRAGDTLYVGLSHHDRIFVNDSITYFATQRLPVTKWSQFDPFLQNRADIQQEMIEELEQKRPPYIVLDAEFEGNHEPNGSSVSTGVYLLDDYLAAHYSFAAKFGELTVAKRRDDPN